MDVALGKGGALLGIQVGVVVLVGCLGAGVRQVRLASSYEGVARLGWRRCGEAVRESFLAYPDAPR